MAPIENGIFAGFDLHDATSITRLVIALLYWQEGGRDKHHQAVECLGPLGRASLRAVLGRANNDPEFGRVMRSFFEAVTNDQDELNVHGDALVAAAANVTAYAAVDGAEDAARGGSARAPHVCDMVLFFLICQSRGKAPANLYLHSCVVASRSSPLTRPILIRPDSACK